MIRVVFGVAALATALSACGHAAPPRSRGPVPATPAATGSAAPPTSAMSPHVSASRPRHARPRLGPYTVRRVLDARRLDVDVDGHVRRVLALGIAAPKAGTCRTREATGAARRMLAGTTVYLSTDPAQRARREWYVWTADGLYQARLLRAGYGTASARPPLRHAGLMHRAERTARAAHAGLWSAATCAPRRDPQRHPRTRDRHRTHHPTPPHGFTGAAAVCRDGTFSFSRHRSDACAHHGGVRTWLRRPPA